MPVVSFGAANLERVGGMALALTLGGPLRLDPKHVMAQAGVPKLGNREADVLVAIHKLGPQAYGAAITRYLMEVAGETLALGQIYVTLKRLEKKGLVSARTELPRPVKGGRSRNVFSLEEAGARALVKYYAVASALASSEGAEYEGNEKEVAAPVVG